MSGRNKVTKKNSKKSCRELALNEHLNAEKVLIRKLKERKKAYGEFLSQIEHFIGYAREQAKNSDNRKLRLKYLETVEEEESLRDKIMKHLKKNDELIELIKKSNSKL